MPCRYTGMRHRLGGTTALSPASANGFVLAWFAILLTVLLGFAGFCVDFGALYLHIERSQRAADAAALAGAPFLPSDPQSAESQALGALRANGVDPSGVVYIGPNPSNSSQMEVTLADTVPTAFARFVGFTSFSYDRTAEAMWRLPLGLGSPFNVLGYEPPSAGPSWQNGAGPPVEYFLTQNPGGNPKENMDRWSAVNCDDGEDGCAGTTNLEYDPNPRLFDVVVDPGTTGTLAVEVYDPELDRLDSGPGVATQIAIWKPGANPRTDAPISFAGCSPQSYPANDPSSSNRWVRVCTLQIDGVAIPAGRYMLGVSMPGSQGTQGQNDYSLRAAIMSGAAVDSVLTTHVHVFADTELVTHHQPSALLNYYLTKIPSSYAGQTVTLDLFDFGETGAQVETIKFFDTGVEPTGCHLSVASQGISLNPTDGKCSFDVAPYYLKFNGRTQVVTIPIDPSYQCVEVQQTSCWLYLTSQSGSIADEGSSTSLEHNGSPVRLVPNT